MAASFSGVLKQMIQYPGKYLGGRLSKSPSDESAIANGTGAVLEFNGKKVAVYKDQNGKVARLSPVCTHMGCIVGWNSAEKVWDCPCHGSRYAPDGEVINGPAKKPLGVISG